MLHVHLEKADLSGRRSQDPFALVYLLDEATGMSTFQIENNRTQTFDKNIRPEFRHDFFFKVAIQIIISSTTLGFNCR